MKKLLTIAVAALMTLTLVGCGGSDSSASKLVVGTLEMNGDFVEGITNNSYDKDVRDLIHGYNPVVVDADGVLQWQTQVLAEEPKAVENEDGTKTYTVKIKNDLKWNDGEAITAKDYVISYLARSSKEWTAIGGSGQATDLVGFEAYNEGKTEEFEAIKLIDDYTFSATIKAEKLPYYWDKSFVWVYPMPVHVIAKDVEFKTGEKGGVAIAKEDMANIATYIKDEYVKNPTVTCGAYKFISFQDKQVSLEKNENFIGDYRGELPKIDQIVIKTVNADKDVDTLIAGEVDIVNGVVEGEKIEKAEADDNIQTSVYARNGYGNMPIATYYGATKEVEVRHALAYLVDTTKIATAAMGSYGLPCYSDYGAAQKVYVDNKEWVNENLNKYAYSVENANAELDKSSYRFEADGKTPFDAAKASEDYLRYNEKGEVLTISHCGSENNAITDNIKTQLLENAPKAGVKYESTITDFASLLDAYYAKGTGDVTYNVYNMATGYSEVPDPEADNHSKWASNLGGYNSTGIADAELDKCIENIKACTTEEEYEAAWKEYQKRWNYLLPMIPTYTNNYYDFANKKVVGFKTTPFRNWANEICLYSID